MGENGHGQEVACRIMVFVDKKFNWGGGGGGGPNSCSNRACNLPTAVPCMLQVWSLHLTCLGETDVP